MSPPALGAGPAEEVVAGAEQHGAQGLRPQQHPGAAGARGRLEPGGSPPGPPRASSTPTAPGGGGAGITPPPSFPLSPLPGQPPQPAHGLLAGGGDGLAEGQGLLADVRCPPSPQRVAPPWRGHPPWLSQAPPTPHGLSVCPQHGEVPRGAVGPPAAADDAGGAARRLPRGVATRPLQALLRQDVPGGASPEPPHCDTPPSGCFQGAGGRAPGSPLHTCSPLPTDEPQGLSPRDHAGAVPNILLLPPQDRAPRGGQPCRTGGAWQQEVPQPLRTPIPPKSTGSGKLLGGHQGPPRGELLCRSRGEAGYPPGGATHRERLARALQG